MKINCSGLHCKYCGATKYKISNDYVFTCEYCNKSFDLQEIEVNLENKLFIEELKNDFYNKIEELNVEKIKYKKMLLYYQKLSRPRILVNLFLTLLILSSYFLFSLLMDFETFKEIIVYDMFIVILNTVLFIFSKRRAKRKNEKYKPYVEFFAKKVVDCQDKIDSYTKYISQLTK